MFFAQTTTTTTRNSSNANESASSSSTVDTLSETLLTLEQIQEASERRSHYFGSKSSLKRRKKTTISSFEERLYELDEESFFLGLTTMLIESKEIEFSNLSLRDAKLVAPVLSQINGLSLFLDKDQHSILRFKNITKEVAQVLAGAMFYTANGIPFNFDIALESLTADVVNVFIEAGLCSEGDKRLKDLKIESAMLIIEHFLDELIANSANDYLYLENLSTEVMKWIGLQLQKRIFSSGIRFDALKLSNISAEAFKEFFGNIIEMKINEPLLIEHLLDDAVEVIINNLDKISVKHPNVVYAVEIGKGISAAATTRLQEALEIHINNLVTSEKRRKGQDDTQSAEVDTELNQKSKRICLC